MMALQNGACGPKHAARSTQHGRRAGRDTARWHSQADVVLRGTHRDKKSF